MTTAIKFLAAGRIGPHSDFQWPVGEWVETEGPLVLCRNGIHVPAFGYEVCWIDDEVWEIELRGEVLHGTDKHCYRAGRLVRQYELWTPQVQRLLAADCAEDVLHLARDPRAAEAIRVARLFAVGRATEQQLAAAQVAAWAAAQDAARAAAWAAARAAARVAAWAAARDAARAAERVAAWAAERDVTRAAAFRWQSARLLAAITNPAWLENRIEHARSLT